MDTHAHLGAFCLFGGVSLVNKEFKKAETIAAMKESEQIKQNPEQYKRYASFAEALKEVQDNA